MIVTPEILPENSYRWKYLQALLQSYKTAWYWHKNRDVAGYKINSKISVALLHKKAKYAEREIKETSPFTIATYTIKYPGLTLTRK